MSYGRVYKGGCCEEGPKRIGKLTRTRARSNSLPDVETAAPKTGSPEVCGLMVGTSVAVNNSPEVHREEKETV